MNRDVSNCLRRLLDRKLALSWYKSAGQKKWSMFYSIKMLLYQTSNRSKTRQIINTVLLLVVHLLRVFVFWFAFTCHSIIHFAGDLTLIIRIRIIFLSLYKYIRFISKMVALKNSVMLLQINTKFFSLIMMKHFCEPFWN